MTKKKIKDKDTFCIEIMKIISIKIVLPSKSKAFVVFAEEIQRLEIAYKNNHFRVEKKKNQKQK